MTTLPLTNFRFEAGRADGATVRGTIAATSSSAAASVLSSRGLLPLAIEPAPAAGTGKRVSLLDQATVFRSLACLAVAGVPLEKALNATRRVARGRLRDALPLVEARVREGASLATALRERGRCFSPTAIGLVQAGERGVGLDQALGEAASQLEAQADAAGRVRAALTYPLLLALVGTLSVGFIVGFVVPRFAELLGEVGQPLPLATRVLLAVSAAVRRHGALLVGLGCAAAVLAVWALRNTSRRLQHEWLLGVPVIGDIRFSLASARVVRALAALLGTGTPALLALQIAGDAAGDEAVAARLQRARERIAEGAALSRALEGAHALTPLALQLVQIGEASGRLPDLLLRAAAMDQDQAERRLRAMVALLEPALIVAFAGLVAFVSAALLQAVYALRPA